ncbi:hypothetical protein LTR56_011652 [Elasticomyces elasticus]|nr:hypothetical protein LTR56_011652 [Elasticomyces elasticus]KAK3658561.1 hypothetical protein LTR22_008914 [Elasticomyces elasticus]KAK4921210.1 hypothetical protein LTR49_011397 [Elasticomyces elasticus]KAK5761927.1 hypothetical protein LTS12_007990 [Elasticomyces elasticus]
MAAQSPPIMKTSHQCRLLDLPVELQLNIYELVVIVDEPLLLNCGCDSSYRGKDHSEREDADREAWSTGALHAPHEPNITRTCRFIRDLTIPIFYKENQFLAHYCHAADFDVALAWLENIGSQKREFLARLALFDANSNYDEWCPDQIEEAKHKLDHRFFGKTESVVTKESGIFRPVTFAHGDEETDQESEVSLDDELSALRLVSVDEPEADSQDECLLGSEELKC